MSNETASLVIAVDSTGAKNAAVDLDKLTDSAEKVEAAQEKVAQSTQKMASQLQGLTPTWRDNNEAAVKYVNALQLEYDILGKSRAETERYLSIAAGLPAAAQKEAQAIGLKIDAINAESAAMRDLEAVNKRADIAGQNFIERLKQQVETQGLSKQALLAYKAAQLGVTEQAGPLIAGLKEVEQGMDKASGAAERGALSTVGAKRELIVLGHEAMTGNFSKMPGSFMVLAERMHITSALFSPLVVGIGAAAAGAVLLAVAFVKGDSEAKAFNDALIATGDYAGKTKGQMSDMAEAVSKTTGTHHEAADAIAQLAATGRIAGSDLEKFGHAAVAASEASGAAIKDTVAEFVKLGKDPVKESEHLNETMHYLTASVYAQIVALQEQGKNVEAAALAQKTYADAIESMKTRVVSNLGTLESAWHSLGMGAKKAWDYMLGVGRETTVVDKIAGLQKDLAVRLDRNSDLGIKDGKATQDLRDQIALLQSAGREAKKFAEADGERAAAQERGVKAIDAITKSTGQNATKQEQLTIALRDQKKSYDDLRAAVADPTKSAADKSAAIALLADEENQVKRTTERYAEKEKAQKKGSDAYGTILAGITKANEAAKLELEMGDKLTAADRFRIQTLSQIEEALRKKNITVAKSIELKQAEAETEGNIGAATAAADARKAQEELTKAHEQYITTLQSGLDKIQSDVDKERQKTAEIGLSKDAVAALRSVELERQATALDSLAIDALVNDKAVDTYNLLVKQAQAKRDLIVANREGAAAQTAYDLAQKTEKDQLKLIESVDKAAESAFVNIAENGTNAFKKIGQTLKTAVLDMLYQMTLKKWIISVTGSVTGASASAMGTAAGAGNLLGSASNAYSLYGAASGYSSGVNTAAGLMGAGTSAGASGASLAYANGVGAIGGDGLGTLIAGNASWGGVAAGGGALSGLGGLTAATADLVTSNAALGASIGLSTGEAAAAALGAGEAATGVGIAAGGLTTALAAIPVWGWAALAAVAALSIFSKNGTPSGSTGSMERSYDADGNITSSKSPFAVGNGASVVDGLQAQFTALKTLLSATGGSNFAYGAYSGNDNKNPMMRVSGGSFNSGEIAATDDGMKLAASRAVLSALQSSEMPKGIAAIINSIDPAKASAEQIAKLEMDAAAYAQSIKVISAALENMPFANLKGMAFETADALLVASGGLQNLNQNLTTYHDNFYKEEEKRAQKVTDITRALNSAGVGVTEDEISKITRLQYRELVEGVKKVDGANAPAVAALYAMSGAIASIVPVAVDAAASITAISATLQTLQNDRANLQADVMQARGDTGGADAVRRALAVATYTDAETKAYDHNQALRQEIKTLQDASAALATKQAAEIAASQVTQAAADALKATNKGLSDQLAVLKGTETDRSIALRDAVDGTTQSLLKQIYAQQDLKTATQAAAVAATQAAQAATQAAADQKAAAVAAMQSATSSVTSAFNQITAAANDQKAALGAAFQALTDGINAQLSTVGVSIGKLQSLSSALSSTLSNLQVSGGQNAARADAQSTIAAMLETAKSGGGLPVNTQALTTALSTVSKPSEQLFGSFVDYARDFYKTLNNISALNDLTSKGLTSEQIVEATLKAQLVIAKASYDSQITQITSVQTQAKAQLDALNGNTTVISSLKDALAAFSTALTAAVALSASQIVAATVLSSAQLASALGLTSAQLTTAVAANALQITTGAGLNAAQLASSAALSVAQLSAATGLSATQIAAAVALNAAQTATASGLNTTQIANALGLNATQLAGALGLTASQLTAAVALNATQTATAVALNANQATASGSVNAALVSAAVGSNAIQIATAAGLNAAQLANALGLNATQLAAALGLTATQLTAAVAANATQIVSSVVVLPPEIGKYVSAVAVLSKADRASIVDDAVTNAKANGTNYELELYKMAQSIGYLASDVDKALGLVAGATAGYVARAGLTPLTGTTAVVAPPVVAPPVVVPAYISAVAVLSASDRASVVGAAITAAAANGTDYQMELYNLAKSIGYKAQDVDQALGLAAGATQGYISTAGLPQLAVGTNYIPRDMIAQLHEGEAVLPKAFNPAAGGGSGDDSLKNEIQAMRADLNAGLLKIAQNTGKSAKLTDRWESDGLPATRTTT